MKNLFLFFLVIVLLVIMSCTEKVDIEAEKADVQLVLNKYIKAWETLDTELYLEIFSHDDDMVIFNSMPTVKYVGWETWKENVKNGLEQYESAKVSFRDELIKVHSSGDIAWLTCILDGSFVSQGQENNVNGIRTTWILEKRDNKWVIVHSHWSLPQS